MIEAGKLKQVVDLMQKTAQEDDMGGKAIKLTTVYDGWRASVRPASSREVEMGGQRGLHISHIVVMRHYEGFDSNWVLRWGDRYLAVVGFIDVEEASRMLRLECTEGLPQGVIL